MAIWVCRQTNTILINLSEMSMNKWAINEEMMELVVYLFTGTQDEGEEAHFLASVSHIGRVFQAHNAHMPLR